MQTARELFCGEHKISQVEGNSSEGYIQPGPQYDSHMEP
jgi:hypothetical protein